MSISINTSEYIKTKKVVIDGEDLEFHPLTVAQSLKIAELQRSMVNNTNNDGMFEAIEIMIGAFSPADKAKKILGDVPFDGLSDIYKRIAEDNE